MPGKVILAAAGALALAASPVIAQDAGVRASAPTESADDLGGGASTALIVAIVAIALAIFLAADSGGAPDSP